MGAEIFPLDLQLSLDHHTDPRARLSSLQLPSLSWDHTQISFSSIRESFADKTWRLLVRLGPSIPKPPPTGTDS